MKKQQYYDPITKQWLDECPWPPGKMPNGAVVRVNTTFMDSMQREIAANTQQELTDEEKRAERRQAAKDHYAQQRQDKQAQIASDPRAAAYHAMCDGLDYRTRNQA